MSLHTGSILLSNHSQLDQGWHWDKVVYWALPVQNLWLTTWDKEHTSVICRYWACILKAGLWFLISHLSPSSPPPCSQKSRKTKKGMRINDAGMQILIDFVAIEKEKEWILIICQIPLLDLQNTVLLCVFGFLQDILVYFK